MGNLNRVLYENIVLWKAPATMGLWISKHCIFWLLNQLIIFPNKSLKRLIFCKINSSLQKRRSKFYKQKRQNCPSKGNTYLFTKTTLHLAYTQATTIYTSIGCKVVSFMRSGGRCNFSKFYIMVELVQGHATHTIFF